MFPTLDEVAAKAGEGEPMARLCLLALISAAGAVEPDVAKMPESDARRAAAKTALRGAHMGAIGMGGAMTALDAWGKVVDLAMSTAVDKR